MRGRQFAAFLILVMNLMFLCTACQSGPDAVKDASDAVAVSGDILGFGEDTAGSGVNEATENDAGGAKSDDQTGTVSSNAVTGNAVSAVGANSDVEKLGLLREEGRSAILVDGNRFENASAVYEVDIDHDGEKEHIVVERFSNEARKGGVTTRRVSVLENQKVVWESTASPMWNFPGFFLYSENSEAWLVAYDMSDGKTYRYIQFSLEQNPSYEEGSIQQEFREVLGDCDVLTIDTSYYSNLPFDGERVNDFMEKVNGLLGQSTLLFWDTNAQGYLSAEEEAGSYTETLSKVFSVAKKYEDCQTIQEKVERLNQLTMEKWFTDGEMPEALANLDDTISERIAAYVGEPEEEYAELAEDRERWFEAYNGEKLQVIEPSDKANQAEIVYYRADEGETANDAAKKMLEAVYELKLKQEANAYSGFKLTDFAIADQNLRGYSSDTLNPSSIILSWCENGMKSQLTTDEEIDQWIGQWLEQRYGENGTEEIKAMPEDMWLLTPQGYYKYDGSYLVTFVEALCSETEVVDGMIPFIYEGSDGTVDYILMKSGDVYRLQKADKWGVVNVIEENGTLVAADYTWKVLAVHEADVDHDGEDESLIVEKATDSDRWGYGYRFRIEDDGVTVYEDDELLTKGNSNGSSYFLYTEDGVDYLLEYYIWANMGGIGWEFTQFCLDENHEPNAVDRRELALAILYEYSAYDYPFDSGKIVDYMEYVNRFLDNSILLCGFIDSGYAYSSQRQTIYCHEDMQLFWNYYSRVDYSGCDTVEERVEAINQYLADKWFIDGQLPEMPEEYISLMEELITEKRSSLWTFRFLLKEDRSTWFADYNGEKLQIVEPEYESTSPVDYPGRVYYRADEGQTPEEVAKIMVDAMVGHMMEDSQGQEFVITKYRIDDQELTDWADIVEEYTKLCWEDYLQEKQALGDDLLDYAEQWVKENFHLRASKEIPLGEDMWAFHLNGRYRYEGAYMGTYEEYLSWGNIVDGMTEMRYWGWDQEFLLVKNGDVYCLQKGCYWGE